MAANNSSASSVKSMTGFAALARDVEGGRLAIEIKSVNHRYLEFQTRMPEELRVHETAMRDRVAAALTRGKIDCRVTFQPTISRDQTTPNADALAALAATQHAVLAQFANAAPLSVWEIMHAPGVLAADALTSDGLKESLIVLLSAAINELDATRVREGEKLAAMLIERLDRIDQLTHEVAPLVPQMVAAYEEKLRQKISDANVGAANDDRLKQEVVLFASRIDVAEELNRLGAHTAEVRRVLKAGGAIGKRLDFLMQELNRESNTLGSKSVSAESTKVSIELKVMIEQMREQIQNIE
jgi:uncharacterized protein (TIGR00255 family)